MIVNRAHAQRQFFQADGWNVAYHYIIDRHGVLRKLHDEDLPTGHTRNQAVNLNSIAIALEGNFNIDYPSQAQLDTLYALLRDITNRRTIGSVIPHRQASPSSCPGKHLIEILTNVGIFR